MPVADRVAAEAGADLPLLDDLERDRQRAGLERERQVLRLLQALVAERDLPVAADPALNDRRAALHPAVEQDRHVVADVLAGLVAELAPAGAVELEGDDGTVGELVELRVGVLEVAAGDDAAGRRGRRGIGTDCTPDAGRRRGPAQHDAARQLPGDRREVEQAVHPGERGLGHDVLARRGRPATAPADWIRPVRIAARAPGSCPPRRCRPCRRLLGRVAARGAARPPTVCRRRRCRP